MSEAVHAFKPCDVCRLLDGDARRKRCTWCDICKAWICDADLGNFARRAAAMAKRLVTA